MPPCPFFGRSRGESGSERRTVKSALMTHLCHSVINFVALHIKKHDHSNDDHLIQYRRKHLRHHRSQVLTNFASDRHTAAPCLKPSRRAIEALTSAPCVPGIMWAPGRIPAGQVLHEMMSHMDVWPTTATMVGLKSPPHGEMMDNNGKPIYFDGIDNTDYVTGKSKQKTSARSEYFAF
jgi:hypothetical protein